jgi:hypothetical protein
MQQATMSTLGRKAQHVVPVESRAHQTFSLLLGYDEGRRLVFASCGDGPLDAVKQFRPRHDASPCQSSAAA